MQTTFPAFFRERRLAVGLTQFRLAVAAGVTPAAIGNYEAGRAQPRLATMAKLAPALQLSPDELFHAAIDSATA